MDQQSSEAHSRHWFPASTWKVSFYLQAIKYLGFIFDLYGRRLDPANVAAIQRMPPQSDVSSFAHFLDWWATMEVSYLHFPKLRLHSTNN